MTGGCRLCDLPAWRAGHCPKHWHAESLAGRIPPDPQCWPVPTPADLERLVYGEDGGVG